MSLRSRTAGRLAAVVTGIAAVLAPGTSAWAADAAPVAWSVSPASADGTADGRTRLEVSLDPGKTATDHVTVANASTTEQTFRVYGADAFNTADGGYDLLASGVASTDAGRWVSVDHDTVTVPALAAVTVAVTVAAPADAAPGDHAAGIVVSRAQPAPDAKGVLVDSRVAVRLSVRVAGALAPRLDVEDVHVGYTPSWVPFGAATAHVSYRVHNRGNVTVVGQPRLRVDGPFGTVLSRLDPQATHEVLPGQSFTVQTALPGVAPALVGTAVVDVKTAAAPGPATQIPLVSSTARARFAAVPSTGLVLLVLLGLAVRWALRRRSRRRAEGEAMWAELVDEARAGRLPDATGAAGVVASLALGVVACAALLLLPATASSAADEPPGPTLSLSVPAPSAGGGGSTTVTSGGGSTTTTTTFTGGAGAGTGAGGTGSTGSTPVDGSSAPADAAPSASPGASPAPSPSPSRTAQAADTIWRMPRGLTPLQRAAAALTGALVLGAGGLAWHLLPLTVRPRP